mgnify:FL=1
MFVIVSFVAGTTSGDCGNSFDNLPVLQGTECPKIYRKSVLHLLKYRFAADPIQKIKFWDTPY